MTWTLRLCQFDYEVLYRPVLVHQILSALSRLLHPLNTQTCEPIDDDICTFERLKEMEVPGTSFPDNAFETKNVLNRSQTISFTLVDYNLDDALMRMIV